MLNSPRVWRWGWQRGWQPAPFRRCSPPYQNPCELHFSATDGRPRILFRSLGSSGHSFKSGRPNPEPKRDAQIVSGISVNRIHCGAGARVAGRTWCQTWGGGGCIAAQQATSAPSSLAARLARVAAPSVVRWRDTP
jgi:hypothetical protein